MGEEKEKKEKDQQSQRTVPGPPLATETICHPTCCLRERQLGQRLLGFLAAPAHAGGLCECSAQDRGATELGTAVALRRSPARGDSVGACLLLLLSGDGLRSRAGLCSCSKAEFLLCSLFYRQPEKHPEYLSFSKMFSNHSLLLNPLTRWERLNVPLPVFLPGKKPAQLFLSPVLFCTW